MLSGLKAKLKQMVYFNDNDSPLIQKAPPRPVAAGCEKSPAKIVDENLQFKDMVYNIIRNIKDPEKPSTLEDLDVVYEDGVEVTRNFDNSVFKVVIEFTPTVPHCSLASLIGLCIAVKLQRYIPPQTRYKLRVTMKKGSHNTEEEIIKQINDKERVAAAMEIGGLKDLVTNCISEDD